MASQTGAMNSPACGLSFAVSVSLRTARLRAMSEEVLRSVRKFLPPEVQLLDAVMGVPSR